MHWNKYFMSMCNLVAMRSKDRSTQFGAVIVGNDNQILSTGYNSFPRGINDDMEERQERPLKYSWFEHAERNAIYNAAMSGVKLKNSKIYVNGLPCMDCARAIVQVGIKEVIVDKYSHDIQTNRSKGDSIWEENYNNVIKLFKEANVKLIWYRQDTIKEIKRLIRGEYC